MNGRRHRRREAGRRAARSVLSSVTVLPTLCTLGNLVAGFAALHYAIKPPLAPVGWRPLEMACALVFLGMLLDAIDGSLARLTKSSSDLGAQIDSLADVVTFGVAPAFIVLQLVDLYTASEGRFIIGPGVDDILGRVFWAVAAVYVSCAALRLARFNLQSAAGEDVEDDHSRFQGLPSPGAAGTVVALVLLHQHLYGVFGGEIPNTLLRAAAIGILIIMFLCAVGMVSDIPYTHFTNRFVKGGRSFGYVVTVVLILAIAIWFPAYTLALAFCIYALSGPFMWGRQKLRSMTRTGA